MALGFPLFLAVVGGLVVTGVFGIVVGVLAFRFGVSRGFRDLVGRLMVPIGGFGGAALLVAVNPVDGEYRAGILWTIGGLLGPLGSVYDVYRVFQDRRLARERIAREAERPAWDLSKLKPLFPIDDVAADTDERDGFAIASFTVGLLGGVGLSVALGVVALRRIRKSGRGGKRLAIAGMTLSVLWPVAVIAVLVSHDSRARVADGGAPPLSQLPRVLAVIDTGPGGCWNPLAYDATPSEVVVDVNIVPCSEPHDREVFAKFSLRVDGRDVGDIAQAAMQSCVDRFED